jgi:hypothetical protein
VLLGLDYAIGAEVAHGRRPVWRVLEVASLVVPLPLDRAVRAIPATEADD